MYQKRNNVYSSYFYCLHIILKKYIDISGKSGRVRVGYTRLVGYIGYQSSRVESTRTRTRYPAFFGFQSMPSTYNVKR